MTGSVAEYGLWLILALLALAFFWLGARLIRALAAGRRRPDIARVRANAAPLAPDPEHPRPILATLQIITARPDLIDQIIELDGRPLSLGRDPQQCDFQLYDDSAASTVSGRHCTLQYDRQQRVFLLVDNASTNGTTLNARPLPANEPAALRDGDIIVLGSLSRLGAKLRFETPRMPGAKPATPVGVVGVATELGAFEPAIFTEESLNQSAATMLDETVDAIDIVPPQPDGRERAPDERPNE